ncbi:hypothetical protein LSTR_LSTR004342 [Laodelphax striatellus]|uniref:Odorant receptor n=1 Tax=Laodelphax striatellus TaxID=195883 RepID=A0A482X8X1_LAOST|nr:hypothetical protein LSTR_LSTR004342 [Laodelphax striatellus]
MRPRWNNFQARYQSIEDLIVLAFMTIIVCEIGWSFNKIVAMVEITKSKLYPASQPLSDIQKSIIEKMTEELLVIIKTFAFIVAGFSLINGFIPFLHGIFFISRRDINNVSQEQIPMPVECWIPYKLENVITYIIFVSPQVLMFAICSFVGFIWFAPFITSLFHLMKEIDILCHSIKDMDYWLKEKPDTDYDFHLKQYFKGVIEHHQNICRTVQQLNEALSVFLFLFNCVCCAQICVSLYSCFENGQLERAIADCNWMSKPKWFRSSLRIMILRSIPSCGHEIRRLRAFALLSDNEPV